MDRFTSFHGLRAGVIGTGFIGPVHVEALRRLGIQVVALCDLPQHAENAARRLGIPSVYTNHRDLLSSPDIDVVHITTPNRLHARMALDALAAGKHCVCEKPLGMNTRETKQIAARAKASKSIFAVNYNVRFYPAVLQLRSMIARGDFGEIIHVNGSYLQDWLFKETDYNWRLLPGEGGRLRAVADIGTHWMDTVAFILNASIESVFADLVTWHKTRKRPAREIQTFAQTDVPQQYLSYAVKTEDFGHVLLRFSTGAHGNLSVSQVAAGRKNCIRIEIYGSERSAWWCSENPEVLNFGHRDRANELAFRGTPAFGPAASYIDFPPGHVEGFPDTFKMLFRAVYGAVAGESKGERLFANAQEGHQEVAVCEAILQSHRKMRWVKL